MKLQLTNFGCYTSRTFDLPDEGNILISGPSGRGKTTIIRALEFALFGTGNKVVTFGKKKCKVELTFKKLHILRTKGPNRLVVNGTMEDDEAQHFLSTTFPDQMFFLHQNNRNTFLSLSSAGKLEYLERVTFQHIDLPTLKKQVKEKSRALDLRQASIQGELEVCAQLTKEPVHSPVSMETTLTLDECDDHERDARTRLGSLKQQQKDYHVYVQSRTEFDATRSSLQSRLTSLQMELTTYPDDLEDRVIALRALQKDHQRWAEYNRVKSEYDEQRRLYEESIQTELTTLTEKIDACTEAIDAFEDVNYYKSHIRLFQRVHQLQEDLAQLTPLPDADALRRSCDDIRCQLQETYTCPSCTTTLQLNGDGLEVVAHPVPRTKETTALRQELNTLETQLAQHATTETQARYVQTKLDSLSPKLATDTTLDELEMELKTLLHQHTLKSQYEQEQTKVEHKFRTLKRNLLNLKREYKFYEPIEAPTEDLDESDLQMCQQQLSLQTKLRQQEQHLQRDLNALRPPTPVRDVDPEIASVETQLTLLHTTRRFLQQQQEYDRYLTYKTQLDELTMEQQTNTTKLLTLARFRELILKTEAIAFANTIQTLNTNVQHYLDAFFTEDALEVKVLLRKTSKTTKVESTNVHLEVYYKNTEVDISTLSGGEYDRVVLAFALALTDMNVSPFIVLDECVSSLDQSTASQVCDFIRDQSKGKLVLLIAHQIVTGMFDQIIHL